MRNPRFVVDHLVLQFEATLDMLKEAVEKCPDALWEDCESKPAYWHEAYHALFWCDNFVGNKDKHFERCPVGVDIDPRLFQNPGERLLKNALLDLLAAARLVFSATPDACGFYEKLGYSSMNRGYSN